GGDAAEVDLAASELDEEQDVEAIKPGGLDGEEVTGEHLGGVLADELPPARLAATRRRRNVLAAQDPGHLHVGDRKAELERLDLMPPIGPGWVLRGELQKALPPLRIASRTLPGRALAKGRPLAADQIAVPAEQGLRPRQ